MFERGGRHHVVEAQVFTDFPDQLFFNLPAFVVNQIRAGVWQAPRS